MWEGWAIPSGKRWREGMTGGGRASGGACSPRCGTSALDCRGGSMMGMKRGACEPQMSTVLRGSCGVPGLQEPPGPGRGCILCSRERFHCGGDRARRVPSGMLPSTQAKERRPTTSRRECRGGCRRFAGRWLKGLRWMRVSVMMVVVHISDLGRNLVQKL